MWTSRGEYSWIRVKVGLETWSGSAAPRPLAIPLASVVLPAPRLPIRSTTPRAGSSRANFSPYAMVSSSDRVSMDGGGQVIEQLGSDEGLLGFGGGPKLSGESVEVDGRDDGSLRLLGELGEEAGDQPGEDIAD